MIEAVGFDLDGTLIESTDSIVDSMLHTFDSVGEPPPTREEIVATISAPLEDQMKTLSLGNVDECAKIYRAYYDRTAIEKTTLLPGVFEGLKVLREEGLKLGIATSKRRASAEPLLDALGISGLFEACIGREDVVLAKPHPEAVLSLLDTLQVDASSAFFVGDTAYDVGAAHAAGVRCLCVTTGYATAAALEPLNPEGIFSGFSELTAYIMASCNADGAGKLLTDPQSGI